MVLNRIYQVGKLYLDLDISEKENELGCAEAVNFLFKRATGEEIGGNVSTYKMYLVLKGNDKFRQVSEPKEGDIIISPTGYGVGNGHVGVVSDNNKIMSNNSFTKKWDEHLTLETWKIRYSAFPIEFYRHKFAELDDIEKLKEENLNLMKENKEYKEANASILKWIAFYFK